MRADQQPGMIISCVRHCRKIRYVSQKPNPPKIVHDSDGVLCDSSRFTKREVEFIGREHAVMELIRLELLETKRRELRNGTKG